MLRRATVAQMILAACSMTAPGRLIGKACVARAAGDGADHRLKAQSREDGEFADMAPTA